jgi:hypothetical protein
MPLAQPKLAIKASPCASSNEFPARSRNDLWCPTLLTTAEAVIITLPSALLADETLSIIPPLPEKIAAAAGLPLGLADKLFFSLSDAAEFDKESRLFGRTDRSGTGVYHFRPFGRPQAPSLLNSTPLGNGAIRRPPALWERTPQGRANVLACGQSTLRVNNPTPPSFGSSVPICAIRAALNASVKRPAGYPHMPALPRRVRPVGQGASSPRCADKKSTEPWHRLQSVLNRQV